MTPFKANLLLLLAGAIWGMGFIAQQTAMDDMGPLLFIACRFLLAGSVIFPFMIGELRRSEQTVTSARLRRFVALGVVFFTGMALQQVGLLGTTVTNAGFLTTLYVVLVPIIILTVFRERPPAFVWPATAVSILGIYCLSFGSLSKIAWGDWFILAGAAVWAVHVILVGRFASESKLPVAMTCVQFFVCGVVALMGQIIAMAAGAVEFAPDIGQLSGAVPEILYAGIFSGGLAFTLQAVGQRYTRPSVAAILMASESLFAALLGAILLGERLHAVGYLGCALIFTTIVAVEVLQAGGSETHATPV